MKVNITEIDVEKAKLKYKITLTDSELERDGFDSMDILIIRKLFHVIMARTDYDLKNYKTECKDTIITKLPELQLLPLNNL